MVIKQKDSMDTAIGTLEALAARAGLSPWQKTEISEELAMVRKGDRGEREAAYFIDFELGNGNNYAIIHDLRLEHEGRVAQIDHLIIGRMADIILVESKNFSTVLRVNDLGEFEVKTRFGWKGIPSPIEQSRRHEAVLGALLHASELLPRRLGFSLRPDLHSWVLVPAACTLDGRRETVDMVKMDMFGARMRQWIDRPVRGELWKMAKAIGVDTLRDFATALAAQHRPIVIDYAAKFGIEVAPPASGSAGEEVVGASSVTALPQGAAAPSSKAGVRGCATCGEVLDNQVIRFCQLNSKRFRGEVYCRSCQAQVARSCDECATPVDSKTEAFCRFNSQKFAKRVLCRGCQGSSTGASTPAGAIL